MIDLLRYVQEQDLTVLILYVVLHQIQPLFEKAEAKNKLLRSVAGGGVEQIGQLMARWDKFELMLESHELMVKEQVLKWLMKIYKGLSTMKTMVVRKYDEVVCRRSSNHSHSLQRR